MQLAGGGDGIAYLARLMHAALSEPGDRDLTVVEVAPANAGGVTVRERLRFAGRLASAELRGGPAWWLFSHVGIARAYTAWPGPLRRRYGVVLNGIEAWDPALSADRKAVVRGADLRMAISHWTARRVAEVHPDLGDIRPCPLGIFADPATGEADGGALARLRPRSVAIVGRMSAAERYKGHDQLLECWPGVVARVPDAQLVVVGRGSDVDRLRAKAGALGVADHVLFTGFVSDATLAALLERVAAFAMPSRGEGFGFVYLEAMRAGLPCIGSSQDAATDIVVDGETGFLVEPDDIATLAGRVASLLADGEMRGRMGAAGRERFHAHFTYERFRTRFLDLLASTLDRRA